MQADSPHTLDRAAVGNALTLPGVEGALCGEIVAMAPDAIVAIDSRYRIILFNRGAEEMFGYTAAEVAGQSLDLLLPEAVRERHARQHLPAFASGSAARRRMGDRGEVQGRRKGGKLFPAEVAVARTTLRGEMYFSAILRDVSSHHARERELARQRQELATANAELLRSVRDERNHRNAAERAARARDEMLAIVSHDLRNPLSAISLGAASLANAPTAELPRIAGIINRSTHSALHIIRDLLDISAIEAGRLSCYRERMLTQVIAEQVVTMFAEAAAHAGVAFSVEVADAPRWIDVDVDRVIQAVGNLVANAIKFTPDGGSVSVRCFAGGPGELRIEVADTGSGIPAEHLPFLFDRFWQGRSRHGGAGLGLGIAHGIAASHGGSIEVASQPGAGSTFTLIIPAAVPASEAQHEGEHR